jgi:hypothetical protein
MLGETSFDLPRQVLQSGCEDGHSAVTSAYSTVKASLCRRFKFSTIP